MCPEPSQFVPEAAAPEEHHDTLTHEIKLLSPSLEVTQLAFMSHCSTVNTTNLQLLLISYCSPERYCFIHSITFGVEIEAFLLHVRVF